MQMMCDVIYKNGEIMMNKKTFTKSKKGYYQTTVKAWRNDGSIYRKFLQAKSEDALLKKIQLAENDYNNGRITIHHDIKFFKLAEIYFNVYQAESKTAYSYGKTYNKHIQPFFGNKTALNIQPFLVKQFVNSLVDKKLTHSTIVEIILIARNIFKVGIEHNIFDKNVFSNVYIPEDQEILERQPITSQQQELIEKFWQGHRMGVPAMLMLYMGIRRGELLALTYKDIDFAKKTLRIDKQITFDKAGRPSISPPKTKTSKRTLLLPDFIVNMLADFKQKNKKNSPVIAPAIKSKSYMSQSAYERAWDSFLNYLNLQAGGSNATRSKKRIQVLEPFTAHQLRHTCATMLFEADVDPKTAQKILGHASLKITMDIYTHLRNEKEMDSIANYENLINQRLAIQKTQEHLQEQEKFKNTQTDNIVFFPIKKVAPLN